MINFWEKVMAALSPCIHMPHRVCTNGNCCLKGINYSDPFRHVNQLRILGKKSPFLSFHLNLEFSLFIKFCFIVWHVKIFTGMCNKSKWKSFCIAFENKNKRRGKYKLLEGILWILFPICVFFKGIISTLSALDEFKQCRHYSPDTG